MTTAPLLRLCAALVGSLCALAGCGGGEASGAPVSADPEQAITYANSVVLGLDGTHSVEFRAGTVGRAPTVRTDTAAALLAAGTTSLVAQISASGQTGVREVCVSGRGDSTNVVADINLGVIAQSAAVLFDAHWQGVDSAKAWANAVANGAVLTGWENCGIKPEGPASPSSRLMPTGSGGFAEDVYDGNPGTTFNVVSRHVAPADVTSMLSSDGLLTREDPSRPLRLTLRAYPNQDGSVIWVEVGVPAEGARASASGFIAMYWVP